MTETFILKTSSGATILAFSSYALAEQARLARQQRYTRPLGIYRQRLLEEKIA